MSLGGRSQMRNFWLRDGQGQILDHPERTLAFTLPA